MKGLARLPTRGRTRMPAQAGLAPALPLSLLGLSLPSQDIRPGNLAAVHGFLTAAAPLGAEHTLQAAWASVAVAPEL